MLEHLLLHLYTPLYRRKLLFNEHLDPCSVAARQFLYSIGRQWLRFAWLVIQKYSMYVFNELIQPTRVRRSTNLYFSSANFLEFLSICCSRVDTPQSTAIIFLEILRFFDSATVMRTVFVERLMPRKTFSPTIEIVKFDYQTLVLSKFRISTMKRLGILRGGS